VRAILDAGGLTHVRIVVSGGLDEGDLLRLEASKAPIDVYGVGTSVTTSSDAPALDCAYKLQEYGGRPRRKKSEDKATWPGRKQVWRQRKNGVFAGDMIALESEQHAGEPLLVPVMLRGQRLSGPTIAETRTFAAAQLAQLPPPLRRLEAHAYPVEISARVRALAAEADRMNG
jgi:nicotinate phosphoribosyltransferase